MTSATDERLLYFDTSALLPYYREEPLSGEVQSLLQASEGRVVISDLVEVEIASALARWVRMRELSEAQAVLLQCAFAEDSENGCYRCMAVSHRHFRQAREWLLVRKTSLRTLDTLHLACARDRNAELVTADRLLAKGAQVLGIGYRLLE
jgi:predicted nucleic acid-binding protein